MSLEVVYTNRFKKDFKLIEKQHKNIDLLLQIIDRLANEEILEPKYCDHLLKGNYANSRELHIEPDFLLIYRFSESNKIIFLERLGSHSDLF